jgi:DNA-binding HxlR family transcriptional regulator
VGDKWTLLIVRDLVAGPRRFVGLQRGLPGISTEQLRSRLSRMVADGLLTRQRYREVPPRVEYELTDRAKELMPVLGALARWGYDWAWSAPRPGEDIDLGAIVRLAPGLLAPPKSLSGSVALEATGKHGAQRTYLLTARRGRVTVEERDDERADARVHGPQKAWIAAFGHDASRSGLKFEGNKRLADTLLDGLAPVETGRRASAAA